MITVRLLYTVYPYSLPECFWKAAISRAHHCMETLKSKVETTLNEIRLRKRSESNGCLAGKDAQTRNFRYDSADDSPIQCDPIRPTNQPQFPIRNFRLTYSHLFLEN